MIKFKQFINEDVDIDTQLKKLGLVRGGKGYKIGKVIGGNIYVHKNYENQFPIEELEAAKEAYIKVAGDKPYQVVKYDPKNKNFSFIYSDDFDTNPEPSVHGGVTVKSDGTAKKFKDAGWIYHHKWQWVADDYKGFDVDKEKRRSLQWSSMEGIDKSRIGQRKFWDAEVVPKIKEAQDSNLELVSLFEDDSNKVKHSKQGNFHKIEIIEDGKSIGEIELQPHKDYILVQGIFVEIPYRNKGIATTLYEKALEYSKKLNKKGIISDPSMREKTTDKFWDNSQIIEVSGEKYNFKGN